VGIVGEVIVCYHTLAVGLEDAPERLKKGLAKHPVAIMLLARLAIDHRWCRTDIRLSIKRACLERLEKIFARLQLSGRTRNSAGL
jgi:hypothetical protein